MDLEVVRVTEVYNCVGSTVLGYSAGYLLGIRPGVNTGFEARTTVGLALEWTYVSSMGISGGTRGK